MLLALALSTVLAQSDAPAATSVSADQSAAEKAANAAQKAAEAAQRIADVVAPRPAGAAAAGPAAPAEEKWKGSVGLGLTFITGNSQTLTLTGNAAADRKWDAWSLGIRLNGAYGLANPDNTVGSTASTTARRGAGTIRGDRQFGESFAAIFVLAGSEFDHMKNIESRSIGETVTVTRNSGRENFSSTCPAGIFESDMAFFSGGSRAMAMADTAGGGKIF